MEIYQFLSSPRQTAFAPEWSYVLGEDTITGIDYKQIATIVLSKETEIVANFPSYANADAYTGLGENSLTSRFKYFNVFAWEDAEIEKLKDKIFENYKEFLNKLNVPRRKVWIQCWANVLRKNEEMKPHIHSVHPFSYLGGHISIQCDNTSTVYINPVNQINDPEILDSPNNVGKITIFQNCIPHYTTLHSADSERITIAFDLIVDEQLPNMMEDHVSNLVLFDNI